MTIEVETERAGAPEVTEYDPEAALAELAAWVAARRGQA